MGIFRSMSRQEKIDKSEPHFQPAHRDSVPADFESAPSNAIAIKTRFWIEKNGKTFLSMARITLLQRIRQYGSITKAAKSMNISYRHAWKMVSSMNQLASSPLVLAQIGGKGGGGAQLTDAAFKAIQMFQEIYHRMKQDVSSAHDSLVEL